MSEESAGKRLQALHQGTLARNKLLQWQHRSLGGGCCVSGRGEVSSDAAAEVATGDIEMGTYAEVEPSVASTAAI